MVTVVDSNGIKASAEVRNSERPGFLFMRLEDGRAFEVAGSAVARNGDLYELRVGFDDVAARNQATIPLAEEELIVGTQTVEKRLRLHKHVHSHEETIDQPVLGEELEVRRVPVNREVAEPFSAREEGDTVIIPVFEEQIVTRKRLVLREEVHISKRKIEQRIRETVSLRSEDVSVGQDESDKDVAQP